MKSLIKNTAALCTVAMLLLLIGTANAESRPPGGRGGFRGGFGGPRYGFRGGFGFGYRGYYRPSFGFGFGFGYPSIGLRIGVLPYGYWPFYYGPDLYYCYDGIYYRQYDNNYEVVAPPVGAETPKLPKHANPIMINGEQYFELNGVYYKEVTHPDGTKAYLIAGKDGTLNTSQTNNAPPKVGDIIDQLPQDCRTVTIEGKKYFVSPDDVYYEEFVDNGGSTAYRVAGIPATQNNKPE